MSFLTSFVASRLCNRYDDSAEKRLKKDILHTYIYYILPLPEFIPRSCLASPFPPTSLYISDPILTIVASVTTPEREHFLLSLSTLLTPGIPLFPHFGHIQPRYVFHYINSTPLDWNFNYLQVRRRFFRSGRVTVCASLSSTSSSSIADPLRSSDPAGAHAPLLRSLRASGRSRSPVSHYTNSLHH